MANKGGGSVRPCRVQGACTPSHEIVCTNICGTLVQVDTLSLLQCDGHALRSAGVVATDPAGPSCSPCWNERDQYPLLLVLSAQTRLDSRSGPLAVATRVRRACTPFRGCCYIDQTRRLCSRCWSARANKQRLWRVERSSKALCPRECHNQPRWF